VCVAVAVAYYADDRPRHGIAFVGIAVVAAIGMWFAASPRKDDAEPEEPARPRS
jgi:hypothetical protein